VTPVIGAFLDAISRNPMPVADLRDHPEVYRSSYRAFRICAGICRP
jgi:hypothetical protein